MESVFTELASVRDLLHGNICNCQYGFLADDAVYIVLDIAFGGDLRYALKHSNSCDPVSKLKTFDEKRAMFYLCQVSPLFSLIIFYSNHRSTPPAILPSVDCVRTKHPGRQTENSDEKGHARRASGANKTGGTVPDGGSAKRASQDETPATWEEVATP